MTKDQDLREDIAAAKNRMKSKFGAGKEIKRLESHLVDGEHVDRMTSGTYRNGTGLVTLTDRRILFTLDGMRTVTEDFPFDRVSSIGWSAGLLGTIVIHAAGATVEIKNVSKSEGKELVEMARERISSPGQPAAVPAAAAAPDPMEQLRKLGELHDAGILSDEEFNAKKAELLARL